MTTDGVDPAIRRAIGGDVVSVSWILEHADSTNDAVVIAMAALLERRSARLVRADGLATTSRDRQVVAIVRAHLDGQRDLVDALARDHLVDYPGSLIVSWIASNGAVDRPASAPLDET